MTIISQSEFSRIVGISRQAIYKAITSGNLPYVADGKKKKIDIDDPAVQLYIKENSIQRERAQGKKKPSEKPAPKSTKPTKSSNTGQKNSTKSKSKSKVKDNKHKIIDDPSDLQEIDTSAFDLNQREKLARTKLAELKLENGKKKNLPTDFIEDALFRHIEKLHSNVERYAGIKIKEVCMKAIEAGEVGPRHVEKMVNEMLTIIYNTTQAVKKEIKKYEPKI